MFRGRKDKLDITTGNPQFTARYVGKVETFVPGGKGCTRNPVQKIWDHAPEEKHFKPVTLLVSPEGMLMKGHNNRNKSETMFDIRNISYCCAEQGIHEKIFSWIYRDPTSKKLECHAVLCSHREKAQALSVVLSRMFQFAYKDWKTARNRESERSSEGSTPSKQSGPEELQAEIDHTNTNGHVLSKEGYHGNDSISDGTMDRGKEEEEDSSLDRQIAEMNIQDGSDGLSFSENGSLPDAEVQSDEKVRRFLRGEEEVIVQP